MQHLHLHLPWPGSSIGANSPAIAAQSARSFDFISLPCLPSKAGPLSSHTACIRLGLLGCDSQRDQQTSAPYAAKTAPTNSPLHRVAGAQVQAASHSAVVANPRSDHRHRLERRNLSARTLSASRPPNQNARTTSQATKHRDGDRTRREREGACSPPSSVCVCSCVRAILYFSIVR